MTTDIKKVQPGDKIFIECYPDGGYTLGLARGDEYGRLGEPPIENCNVNIGALVNELNKIDLSELQIDRFQDKDLVYGDLLKAGVFDDEKQWAQEDWAYLGLGHSLVFFAVVNT